jgi:hypothetical protein
MKLEPRDSDFNELTNLERFKASRNRKFGILFKYSNLNQRIMKINRSKVLEI